MTVLEGGMLVVAIVDGVKIAFYANEHPRIFTRRLQSIVP
jgi:hypothetical protein